MGHVGQHLGRPCGLGLCVCNRALCEHRSPAFVPLQFVDVNEIIWPSFSCESLYVCTCPTAVLSWKDQRRDPCSQGVLMLSGVRDAFLNVYTYLEVSVIVIRPEGVFLAGERHYKQGGLPKITRWLNQYLEQTKQMC